MLPKLAPPDFQEPTESVRLIAGVERIALCGRFRHVSRHRHAAPALVIGVDGPLHFIGERSHESRAVLIRPGFAHAVDTRGGRLAMFVLPPLACRDTERPGVKDLAAPGRWVELGESVFRQQLVDFGEIDHALTREHLELSPIDERLRFAVDVLAKTLEENLSIDEIASTVRLSASRLMSLANAELGTPLRAYRRWLRAFQVARGYAAGTSLTQSALAAGFSSSAHLSSTIREHFGIRPSDVLTPRSRSAIRLL